MTLNRQIQFADIRTSAVLIHLTRRLHSKAFDNSTDLPQSLSVEKVRGCASLGNQKG